MARNHLGITDTGRMEAPTRHFPRQILWIIILVSLVIGFSLLGLSQTLWHGPATSIDLPPNQQVIPPVPTEPTPTPTKTPPTIIEVKWETNGPPNKLPIAGIIAKKEVVYALTATGQDVYVIWKNEGKDWQTTTEIAASQFDLSERARWIGESPWISDDLQKELTARLQTIYKFQSTPDPPYRLHFAVDPNNEKNFTAAWFTLYPSQKRIFLSLNRGQSWFELISPPAGDVSTLAVFSSESQLKIYVGLFQGYIWQTTIQTIDLPH